MSETRESFSNFRENLKIKSQRANGNETFQANVVVKFQGRTIHECLQVTLHLTTYEYGRIAIDDGERLNSTFVHLDFNPKFQDYILDSDGTLVITGESSKMGGLYEVLISEA